LGYNIQIQRSYLIFEKESGVVRIKQVKPFWKLDYPSLLRDHNFIWIKLLGLSLFAILALVGCKPSSNNMPFIPKQATPTSEESITQSLPLLTPVTQPIPTVEPEQSFAFEPSFYVHPQDLFSVQVSEKWSVTQEQDGAKFMDNEQKLSVDIEIVNTGYTLDAISFENMIETGEKDNASMYEEYVEIDRQPLPASNSHLLIKQFSDQGIQKTLASLYQQEERAVLILDFLIAAELFEPYKDTLNTMIDSIQVNADAVADLPIYSFDQEKKYSNGYFSIQIPSYWRINHVTGENSIVDTITSPDEQAIIQTIVYDDGQHMSRNIAGDLVLALLRENYTKSITVLADETLADGREKLSWQSKNADYRGITTFETSTSTLFMITVLWGNDPEQYYQDILKDIIDSYTDQPGEGRSIQMTTQ
jgi:hypothetical protein